MKVKKNNSPRSARLWVPKIHELLTQLQCSQSELARRIGVKQPTISAWLKGAGTPPSARSYVKLANEASADLAAWFFQQAGVGAESALPAGEKKVVRLRVVNAIGAQYFYIPLKFVPNPRSTFCVKFGSGLISQFSGPGIAVVDTTDRNRELYVSRPWSVDNMSAYWHDWVLLRRESVTDRHRVEIQITNLQKSSVGRVGIVVADAVGALYGQTAIADFSSLGSHLDEDTDQFRVPQGERNGVELIASAETMWQLVGRVICVVYMPEDIWERQLIGDTGRR